MVKHSILFLIIFISVSCSGYGSDISDDQDEYYQFLLKKWQKSADWPKQKSINNVKRRAWMHSNEIGNVVRKAILEHYNIKGYSNFDSIKYTTMGRQKEHWLVRVRRVRGEEVWILISRIDREVLAVESYKTGKHSFHYDILFNRGKVSDSRFKQHRFNDSEHIDSITAITIALTAAEEHFGHEMLFIAVRLMGVHKNHWMVYSFPVIPPSTVAYYTGKDYYSVSGNLILGDQNPRSCYKLAINRYRPMVATGPLTGITNCHKMVIVLISKESGQVLSIAESSI